MRTTRRLLLRLVLGFADVLSESASRAAAEPASAGSAADETDTSDAPGPVPHGVLRIFAEPTYLALSPWASAVIGLCVVWLLAVAALGTTLDVDWFALPAFVPVPAVPFVLRRGLNWRRDGPDRDRQRRRVWLVWAIAPSVALAALALSGAAMAFWLTHAMRTELARSPEVWEVLVTVEGALLTVGTGAVFYRLASYGGRRRELRARVRAFHGRLEVNEEITAEAARAFADELSRGLGTYQHGEIGLFEPSYCEAMARVFALTRDRRILRTVTDQASRRLGVRYRLDASWINETREDALAAVAFADNPDADQLAVRAISRADSRTWKAVAKLCKDLDQPEVQVRTRAIRELAVELERVPARSDRCDRGGSLQSSVP